jgi:hypothetical protein
MRRARITGYIDQVPRRERFEAAHPDVRIACLGPAWQAVIPCPSGEEVVTRYDLKALLDSLESARGDISVHRAGESAGVPPRALPDLYRPAGRG